MGVVAVHIHNLANREGKQAVGGGNPFTSLTVDGNAVTGRVYDPPYTLSGNVYTYFADNIEGWVKEVIKARG